MKSDERRKKKRMQLLFQLLEIFMSSCGLRIDAGSRRTSSSGSAEGADTNLLTSSTVSPQLQQTTKC